MQRRTHRNTLAAAASTGLLLLAACGHHPPTASPEPAAEASPVTFEIENLSSFDCTIYLVVNRVSLHIGSVSTNGVLTVEREWRQLSGGRHLRLRAEVVGSATRIVTDELLVRPGQLVRLNLTPELRMSNWAVY